MFVDINKDSYMKAKTWINKLKNNTALLFLLNNKFVTIWNIRMYMPNIYTKKKKEICMFNHAKRLLSFDRESHAGTVLTIPA